MSHSLSPTFYRLCRWLTRQTIGRVFTLRVEGLEHLPARGPAIICPKHQRWEDIPVIGMALPPPPHYIAKVELFRQPVGREFIGGLGRGAGGPAKPPGDAVVLPAPAAAFNQGGFHRGVPRRHLCPGPGRPRQAPPDSAAPETARPGGPGVPALYPRGSGL